MAVPNQALAPVRKLRLSHGGQERLSFCLDRLRRQSVGAIAQDGRERVVSRVRLTERNNAAARHGAPTLSEVQANLCPPRYAASLKPSPPGLGHGFRPVLALLDQDVLAGT